MAAILNFFQPLKADTYYGGYSYKMDPILNPKWPLKYKNLPFWTKFGFQVDFDVGN
jgi:hypothetical protein